MKEYVIYPDDISGSVIMVKDYNSPVLTHVGIKCQDQETAEKVVRGLELVDERYGDDNHGY